MSNGNLVSGSWDRTIKVWDVNSGVCLKTLTGHSREVCCLVLLNNGHVASGSGDTTIKIWNMESEQCIKTLNGHLEIFCRLEALESGELISYSDDKTVKVWDLNKEGHCIKTLVGLDYDDVASIRIKRQNNYLLISTYKGEMKILDLNRLNCYGTIKINDYAYLRDFICIQLVFILCFKKT